jgi:hypothetical protein
MLIIPTFSGIYVYSCFFDTAEEDQSIEGLDGLLRTYKSNYTRFFEELRKYACNMIYLNGIKWAVQERGSDDSRNLSVCWCEHYRAYGQNLRSSIHRNIGIKD